MAHDARELVARNLPWRSGVSWQVIGLEGLVILAIGLYLTIWSSDAVDIVRQLVAVILLIHSVSLIVSAFRSQADPAAEIQAMRGGVGVTVGAIVLLEDWSEYLPDDAARIILGVGLIAYAVIGLVEAARSADDATENRISAIITTVLTAGLGVVFLTGGEETAASRVQVVGGLVIALAVLLLGYAVWLYRRGTVGTV